MPTFWQTDGTRVDFTPLASRTLQVRADPSEEASALPEGERALTPIIAGVISGSCIAVAWLVALIHILVKRYRRKQKYKQLGQDAEIALSKKKEEEEERRRMEFIVPPDPAVLEGRCRPGERVVVRRDKWWRKVLGAGRGGGKGWIGESTSECGLGGEKGKGKERPTSLGRSNTSPDLRRHSNNGHPDDTHFNDTEPIPTITTPNQTQHTIEGQASLDVDETMELRPPFHRLSTIMSVVDSERFRSRSGTPPHSGSGSGRSPSPTTSPVPSPTLSPGFSKGPRRSSEKQRKNQTGGVEDKSKGENANALGDALKEKGDVKNVVDFATSDPERDDSHPLVDNDNNDNANTRVHKYPPSRLR